jgi:plasmid maintenance system killer protein
MLSKKFKCKETERLFHGRFSTNLPHSIQGTAAIKLKMLHAASVIESLRIPPANRLEAMKGEKKNIAYELTSSGTCASSGGMAMNMTLKS